MRTEPPVTATELIVEFDADGVASVPDDAVLSFGVERSVPRPDDPVTPELMYGRFCPYSNVFASRAEYDQWARDNPGVVSDVHPLDAAPELQARLLGDTAAGSSADRSQNRTAPECTCCDGGEF